MQKALMGGGGGYIYIYISVVVFCFFIVMMFWTSTGSEPVDIRMPTQEGKQTSQESASTSKRL